MQVPALRTALPAVLLFAWVIDRAAADDAADLANKLSNPVSSLISVPFQSNLDSDIGPQHGWRYQLNFQPVIPIPLDDEWNMISRTILPFIDQQDAVPFTGSQSGFGDITQSL